MPMSFVALPHSTGNTVALAMPAASAFASSLDLDLLVAEVALHQVVVADDDAFDERVVHRVLFGFHLGGNLAFGSRRRAARVRDREVVQQFDHARERCFLADRELQRRDTRTELLLQRVERALERRAFAVELVDEDRARDVALLGELPRDLGLHLDALDRRDDEQRQVGRLQRGDDVADEVGVAGRVEDVHLVAVELERARARATPRWCAAAPRGRSRRRSSRLRPGRCAGSLRRRTAAPR